MRDSLLKDSHIEHTKTHEFASYIIQAVLNDAPYRIHGNVLNTGLSPTCRRTPRRGALPR